VVWELLDSEVAVLVSEDAGVRGGVEELDDADVFE
jgi:hypothetical protein